MDLNKLDIYVLTEEPNESDSNWGPSPILVSLNKNQVLERMMAQQKVDTTEMYYYKIQIWNNGVFTRYLDD